MTFLNEYIAMWKNYVNFKDRTNQRGYWMAVLVNVIIDVILVLLGYAWNGFNIIAYLYSLAILVPGIAITIRRLRDAGYPWQNIFWVFCPIAGEIILIIRLVKPSAAPDATPTV